jgi:hypothetical protein
MAEPDKPATAIGPNVKRLIAHKMGVDAIPKGGGFEDGLKFLSSREAVISGAQQASNWVIAAIRVLRQAAEPNPWKNSSDEEIAGHLLRQLHDRLDKLERCK